MRKYLKFSLRKLLIFVTLLGCWLASHMHRADVQRRAVKAIEEYGGWVRYDYQYQSNDYRARNSFDPKRISRIPGWVLDAVGVDFFHSVVFVSLNYSEDSGTREENDNMSDSALQYVGQLPNVRMLLLSDTQARDDSLAHLKRLKKLQWLLMWDAREVSDVGVAHLRGLNRLKTVHISGSAITDESVKVLAGLPHIRELSLQDNSFSNDALKYAGRATQLEELVVGWTHSETYWEKGDVYAIRGKSRCTIDDKGLAHVKDLKNLTLIGIQGSRVEGEGFEHLKGLKKLKSIWIGTPPQPYSKELMAEIPGLTVQ